MEISIKVGKPIPVEEYAKICKSLKGYGALMADIDKGEVSVSLSITTGNEPFRELAETMAELEQYYR